MMMGMDMDDDGRNGPNDDGTYMDPMMMGGMDPMMGWNGPYDDDGPYDDGRYGPYDDGRYGPYDDGHGPYDDGMMGEWTQ